MVKENTTISVDFGNPTEVKKANEKYKNIDYMLSSVNQNGEKQLISFSKEGVIVTTFQHNGWTRENCYDVNGYCECESFNGRWK